MAYTPPRTWVTGETVTASLLNAQVRDNLLFLRQAVDDNGSPRLLPDFTNDARIADLFWIPVHNITGDKVVTVGVNGSIAPTYNATPNWMYNQFQIITSGGIAHARAYVTVSTELLPQFAMECAHIETATSVIRLGLMDGVASADPTNGLFFRSTSGGNWFAVARNGGVETATDTGIAASTTPKRFLVSVNAINSVAFSIAGAVVATITSANIPAVTALLTPRHGFVTSAAGTFNAAFSQYMWLSFEVKSS